MGASVLGDPGDEKRNGDPGSGADGQSVEETFDWPAGGIAGAFLTATSNFE